MERLIPANEDHLYLCDNGAVLCGAHLGASAAYTGRDISGQKIMRITPDDNKRYGPFKCETPHADRRTEEASK